MSDKLSLLELCHAFDALRFAPGGIIPIDSGEVVERPHGERDELVIRIDSGIAKGFLASAWYEDFPGGAADRAIFFAKARRGLKVRFQLRVITPNAIRISLQELAPAYAA